MLYCGIKGHTKSFCEELFNIATGVEVKREWRIFLKVPDRRSAILSGEKWLRNKTNGVVTGISGVEGVGSSGDRKSPSPIGDQCDDMMDARFQEQVSIIAEAGTDYLVISNPTFDLANMHADVVNENSTIMDAKKRRTATQLVPSSIRNSETLDNNTEMELFLTAGHSSRVCREQ